MTCNVNNWEIVNTGYLYDHYRFKLDQDLATDLAALGGVSGATITTAGTWISAAMSGGLAAPIAATIGLICVAESAWLTIAANGCGVTVDVYLVNDAVEPDSLEDIPYHYISSQ